MWGTIKLKLPTASAQTPCYLTRDSILSQPPSPQSLALLLRLKISWLIYTPKAGKFEEFAANTNDHNFVMVVPNDFN